MTSVAMARASEALPDGFAIMEKTYWTNAGARGTSYVLVTRSVESGNFGRRLANVIDLDSRIMAPFDDAPYGAVSMLVEAGWSPTGTATGGDA